MKRTLSVEASLTQSAADERLDSFDVAKFVMSIAIVAIHTYLGGYWTTSRLYPWLRLAVPIFFMITSYLFFRKYLVVGPEEKHARLRKFVVRNMQLYLFWLIVFLIPTLLMRDYFKNGLLSGLGWFLNGLFFGSTFIGSWYITAAAIAIVFIALLYDRVPTKVLLGIGAACFIYATLASNYGNFMLPTGRTIAETMGTRWPFGNSYNNFIIAIPWMLAGYLLAKHEDTINTFHDENRLALYSSLAACLILLYLECRFVRSRGLPYKTDSYFMLPLASGLLFVIIKHLRIRTEHAELLRNVSTITYCVHPTFAFHIDLGINALGIQEFGVIKFLLTLGISWLIAWAIIKLEKKPGFGLLRYSH